MDRLAIGARLGSVLVVLVLVGRAGVADAYNCVHLYPWPDWTNYHGSSASPWVIDTGSIDQDLQGVSGYDALLAAVYAADVWNQEASSGYFTFAGTVSMPPPSVPHAWILPEFMEGPGGCREMFPSYGDNPPILVVATTDADHPKYFQRCIDDNDQFRAGEIHLPRYEPNGSLFAYHIGSGTYGEDLAVILVHELGHARGLDHDVLEDSVMCSPCNADAPNRHLYAADVECLWQFYGPRTLQAYRIGHWSDGSFGAPTLVDNAGYFSLAKAASAWTSALGWQTAFAGNAFPGPAFWGTDVGIASTSSGTPVLFGPPETSHTGVAPRIALWREWYGEAQLLWVKHAPSNTPNQDPVLWSAYTTDGSAWATPAKMQYCVYADGDGLLGCLDPIYKADLKTSRRPSFGWDATVGRTVTAWVAREASGEIPGPNDKDVFVAVGVAEHHLLPVPTYSGVRSSVGPGVACAPGAAGGWDCVLAYVDSEDAAWQIRTRRFSPQAYDPNTEQYPLAFDPGGPYVAGYMPSSSDIGLYRNAGEWWIVVRPANVVGQPAYVYESQDGASWTISTVLPTDNSPSGPEVQSEGFGGNNITYVE